MPKKSVSVMPTSGLKENSVLKSEKPSSKSKKLVEDEKLSSIPEKPGHEIDEIFSGKKRKKRGQEKADKTVEDMALERCKAKKKKKGKSFKGDEFQDPTSQARKKTQDGLTIYTEEELGIGRSDAGG